MGWETKPLLFQAYKLNKTNLPLIVGVNSHLLRNMKRPKNRQFVTPPRSSTQNQIR